MSLQVSSDRNGIIISGEQGSTFVRFEDLSRLKTLIDYESARASANAHLANHNRFFSSMENARRKNDAGTN